MKLSVLGLTVDEVLSHARALCKISNERGPLHVASSIEDFETDGFYEAAIAWYALGLEKPVPSSVSEERFLEYLAVFRNDDLPHGLPHSPFYDVELFLEHGLKPTHDLIASTTESRPVEGT